MSRLLLRGRGLGNLMLDAARLSTIGDHKHAHDRLAVLFAEAIRQRMGSKVAEAAE